jgi:hypothetical protein
MLSAPKIITIGLAIQVAGYVLVADNYFAIF